MRVALNKVHRTGLHQWTIEDVEDYKDYYELLECSLFDVVMVEWKGHELSVFIDDEGMLKPKNMGRRVAGMDEPILFGNIVVTGGVDKGGNTLPLPEELSLLDMMDFSGKIQWITKG